MVSFPSMIMDIAVGVSMAMIFFLLPRHSWPPRALHILHPCEPKNTEFYDLILDIEHQDNVSIAFVFSKKRLTACYN
jgi:hypothetical protein